MAKKSDDYYVDIPAGSVKADMLTVVEAAASSVGLYVSHIGSYSRKKYPGSVHWHFKRDAKEPGLIDATFWDVESLFWLMVRHAEPDWVKQKVPQLLRALRREFKHLS